MENGFFVELIRVKYLITLGVLNQNRQKQQYNCSPPLYSSETWLPNCHLVLIKLDIMSRKGQSQFWPRLRGIGNRAADVIS